MLAPDSTRQGAVASDAGDLAARHGVRVRRTFDGIGGFAVDADAAGARRLAADPRVVSVEQQRTVVLSTNQDNPPSWGLDRIDQRELPLNRRHTYTATAANVTAYVIDSGIWTANGEFGGRASIGFDATGEGNAEGDCLGHGTHVAGTIGGATFGLAKKVKLVGVRVAVCDGRHISDETVVAAVDWVTKNAVKPAVANMSLGGPVSRVMDEAVKRSVASGVSYVVSAGNEAGDACTKSPARVPEVITVGATEATDRRADWSNFGKCVDLFAPGDEIRSAYLGAKSSRLNSGTSMASPHVAGAVALYLSEHPTATPADVRAALIANATKDVVKARGVGSPNRLLFTTPGPDSPPPGPAPEPAPGPAPFPGKAWQQQSVEHPYQESRPYAAVTVGTNDVWAGGCRHASAAALRHWDGATWTDQDSQPMPEPCVIGMAARSPKDIWAVGDSLIDLFDINAMVQHYDGKTWAALDVPRPAEFNQGMVSGVAVVGKEVWTTATWRYVEQGQLPRTKSEILRWTDKGMLHMPLPRETELNLPFIAATSPTDVWVAGFIRDKFHAAKPLVLHYDGTRWTEVRVRVNTDVGTETRIENISSDGPGRVLIGGTQTTLDGSNHAMMATVNADGTGTGTVVTGERQSFLWGAQVINGVRYAVGGSYLDWEPSRPLILRQDPATRRWQQMNAGTEAAEGIVTAIVGDGSTLHVVGSDKNFHMLAYRYQP